MTETEKDLRRAICTYLDDDMPRSIYADWCDDNGFPERAEYIRNELKIHEIGTIIGPHQYMSLSSQHIPENAHYAEMQSKSIAPLKTRNNELKDEAWTKEFKQLLVPEIEYKTITLKDFRLEWIDTRAWERNYVEGLPHRVGLYMIPQICSERVLLFRTSDSSISHELVNTYVKFIANGQEFGPGLISSVTVNPDLYSRNIIYQVEMRIPNGINVYNQNFQTKRGFPYQIHLSLQQFIDIVPNLTWPIEKIEFRDLHFDRNGEYEDRSWNGEYEDRSWIDNIPYSFSISFTSLKGQPLPDWLHFEPGSYTYQDLFANKAVKYLREFHNLPPLKGK